ncbi:MAG: ribulose-phosphate 3-epimerase [Promethearchaeota archaeon]
MKKVAISIHARDDFNINILKGIQGFDFIHLDVMDGIFVRSKNLNLSTFKILHEQCSKPIIGHFMTIDLLNYFNEVKNYIWCFTFHIEEIKDSPNYLIEFIKNQGVKVGIALNPETPISRVKPFLELIDLVLILGVNPGWSGQRFIPSTINKVNELFQYKKEHDFLIDVDGGVNLEIAKNLKNADILTSSSAILNSSNPNLIIKKLKLNY